MIITCEECQTSFNLDDTLIKPSGSKVRCSKCKHVFIAFPEAAPEKQAPTEEAPVPDEEAPQEKAAGGEAEAVDGGDAAPVMAAASDLAAGTESEETAADEATPGDFDLDVDAALEAGEAEAPAEPDFSAFGETIELDGAPEAAADEGSDLDLGLDDLDLEMDEEPAAAGAEGAAAGGTDPEGRKEEDLDLSSLDEILEKDVGAEVESPVEDSAEAEGELELDFDTDFDTDFEMEPSDGSASENELDMSDVNLELDIDEEPPAPGEDAELELDIDVESGEGEAKEVEELDMAGFEETLSMDSPPRSETGEDKAGDAPEELDLELEMEDDTPPAVPPEKVAEAAEDREEELEDLDFELDMEFEPGEDLEPAGPDLEADDTDDLDLSDIEEMLEVKDEEIAGEDARESDSAEAEVEKWKVTPGDEDLVEETAEIDLSDIQFEAEGMEDEEIEDMELDLDISDDVDRDKAEAAAKISEKPEELDISNFEELEMDEASADSSGDGGDLELEFEIEGDEEQAEAAAFAFGQEDGGQNRETLKTTDQQEIVAAAAASAAQEPEKKKKTEKKKKQKKTRPVGKSGPARPILILLLLLIAAFAAVILLDRFGVEVPFVTEYVRQVPYVDQLMHQEVKTIGEITTSEIKSQFVDNEKHGKFFVITGMVKNEFPQSRRFIQLTGRLFGSGKTLVKEETVYCGNSLTDDQLARMDLADINKKLHNRLGDNRSNVQVKPGQEIPFMVVFSQLPQDLEEFTIEVSKSIPVQP